MSKMNPDAPHPTLWRTCRVLANDTRLRLFAQLLRKQPQSVSRLAELVTVTLPVASQSLRALESRGLLRVRRVRRRVEYRIPSAAEAGAMGGLVEALQACLGRENMTIEQVIKLATAFTHPSRIEIYRSLKSGQKSQVQIQAPLRLSIPALSRHLAKLVARGYVTLDDVGIYSIVRHPHWIGRVLADLAGA